MLEAAIRDQGGLRYVEYVLELGVVRLQGFAMLWLQRILGFIFQGVGPQVITSGTGA